MDTEGDCNQLIPLFGKAGVTGMYPFECQAGMDIVAVQRQYPELLIQDSLDKTAIIKGKAAKDTEFDAKLSLPATSPG